LGNRNLYFLFFWLLRKKPSESIASASIELMPWGVSPWSGDQGEWQIAREDVVSLFIKSTGLEVA
jgi:hypothetical protein